MKWSLLMTLCMETMYFVCQLVERELNIIESFLS